MKSLLAILTVLCLSSFAFAQVGTIQSGSSRGDTSEVNPVELTSKKQKVKPGGEYTNADGVKVKNNSDSSGNATIDPKTGGTGSETTVDTSTGFEGDISGVDSNDVVDLSSSNVATVTGTGGTVNVSGGSAITVSNEGGVGATMVVNLPSGSTITVGAGSNVIVNT